MGKPSRGGYFLVHRKVLDSDIGLHPMRWYVFSHLLKLANHDARTISWFGEPRTCHRGSFVCSIRGLADSINIHRQTLAAHIVYLQKRLTIQVEKSPEGTMITFVNYEQYQDIMGAEERFENEDVEQIDQSIDHAVIHDTDHDIIHGVSPNKELNTLKALNTNAPRSAKPTLGALDIFESDEDLRTVLKTVSHPCQKRWVKLYADVEWIKRELTHALDWMEANPKRAPKSRISTFLSKWLKNAYERHRKTIPTNQSGSLFGPGEWPGEAS